MTGNQVRPGQLRVDRYGTRYLVLDILKDPPTSPRENSKYCVVMADDGSIDEWWIDYVQDDEVIAETEHY